jgi:hypothetical protein
MKFDIDKDKAIALGVVAVALVVLVLWVGGGATKTTSPYPAGPSTPPPTPYGTVVSVADGTVVVSMQAPFQNAPVTYTIKLLPSTTVVRHVNKTPAQFAADMSAYKAKHASSTPPMGYASVSASVADIAPGAVIEAPNATLQGGVWTAPQIVIDRAAK